MTFEERATGVLQLLTCSDAEPNKAAVKVLSQAFAEVDAEARTDEKRKASGMLQGRILDASSR